MLKKSDTRNRHKLHVFYMKEDQRISGWKEILLRINTEISSIVYAIFSILNLITEFNLWKIKVKLKTVQKIDIFHFFVAFFKILEEF